MRERLNELKGGLEIEAADPGTRLRAIVPLLAEPDRLAHIIPAVGQLPFVGATPSSLSQTL